MDSLFRSAWFLACAAGAVFACPAFAAQASVSFALGPPNERVFSVADGLDQTRINAIAQTPDGFLWLGTDAGLVRFDGVSFVSVEAPGTRIIRAKGVMALMVDRKGALWVGMRGGAGLVRIAEGRFDSFETELMAIPRRGVFWNSVTSIHEDGAGDLWLGSWNGLLRRNGQVFQAYAEIDGQPIGTVNAIAGDSGGDVWIGTTRGELFRWRKGAFRRFSSGDGLPGQPIRSLAADRTTTKGEGVWAALDGGGLVRADSAGIRIIDPAPAPAGAHLTSIIFDSAGALWVGGDGGLARMDPGTSTFHAAAQGVGGGPGIAALFADRERNVWVGNDAGLVRLNVGRFQPLALPGGGAIKDARIIYETRDGNLWIGTGSGRIYRTQNGAVTMIETGDRPCAGGIWSFLEEDEKRMLIGTASGARGELCRLQGGRFDLLSPRSFPEPVRALLHQSDDTILVGADTLYMVTPAGLQRLPIPDVGFVSSIIEERSGVLWLGAVRGLLRKERDGDWERLVPRNGKAPAFVTALHMARDDTLWVGTGRGIARLRGDTLVAFDADNGLFDDAVRFLTFDASGDLWICAARGIFRVPSRALDRSTDDPILITQFGPEDGLHAPGCLAGLTAQDGRHWFLTTAGPLWTRPRNGDGMSVAHDPPVAIVRPVVERIAIDGRIFDPRAHVKAPPGRRDVRIDYTVPTFVAPARVRFRYRLEPLDRQWVHADHRRQAFYTNLRPGRYRFRVEANSGDENWTASAQAIAIELGPSFHQTRWFQALVGALVLLGVLAIHRLRVHRVNARHAVILDERTRIAREIHDTLAQGFTGIAIQVDTALDRLNTSPDEARGHLEQARLLARTSLSEAHQAVWDLRVDTVSAGSLAEALRTVARPFSDTIEIRVDVSGTERVLPPLLESALLRIGQEALTNAVRHGRPSHIQVLLFYDEKFVRIEVSDDGAGFDATKTTGRAGHFGLQGMRERVQMLRGKLHVDSDAQRGTRISVEVPVRHVG